MGLEVVHKIKPHVNAYGYRFITLGKTINGAPEYVLWIPFEEAHFPTKGRIARGKNPRSLIYKRGDNWIHFIKALPETEHDSVSIKIHSTLEATVYIAPHFLKPSKLRGKGAELLIESTPSGGAVIEVTFTNGASKNHQTLVIAGRSVWIYNQPFRTFVNKYHEPKEVKA